MCFVQDFLCQGSNWGYCETPKNSGKIKPAGCAGALWNLGIMLTWSAANPTFWLALNSSQSIQGVSPGSGYAIGTFSDEQIGQCYNVLHFSGGSSYGGFQRDTYINFTCGPTTAITMMQESPKYTYHFIATCQSCCANPMCYIGNNFLSAKSTLNHVLLQESAETAPLWEVTQGSCAVQDGGCISSPNYPSTYAANQSCSIKVNGDFLLDIKHFQTEPDFDVLVVNGVNYSGTVGPVRVTPNGTITWMSDDSYELHGWLICPLVVPEHVEGLNTSLKGCACKAWDTRKYPKCNSTLCCNPTLDMHGDWCYLEDPLCNGGDEVGYCTAHSMDESLATNQGTMLALGLTASLLTLQQMF